MTKSFNECDKFVKKALTEHSCQSSRELRNYGLRVYKEDHSIGSISASLRKLSARGLAASSDCGGKKVYWITDYGKTHIE